MPTDRRGPGRAEAIRSAVLRVVMAATRDNGQDVAPLAAEGLLGLLMAIVDYALAVGALGEEDETLPPWLTDLVVSTLQKLFQVRQRQLRAARAASTPEE